MTSTAKLLMIANCGRDSRTVDVGPQWIAADLLLANLPETPVTVTSRWLDLAGWDARFYLSARMRWR
jgi:oligo-1,6-glucosidase